MERMQKPGESIDDYIQDMCRLRAQLRTPISEVEMVRVLKIYIKESIKRIIFPMQIQSVEKLRVEYHAIEKGFSNKNSYHAIPTGNPYRSAGRPQVSELTDQGKLHSYYPGVEVEEVTRDRMTC